MKLSHILTVTLVSAGLVLVAATARAEKDPGCFDRCYQETNHCKTEHSAQVCKEREAFCLDACRRNF